LFYNKQLSNREIAEQLSCSIRTVIRWKQQTKEGQKDPPLRTKKPIRRRRHYDQAIFARIKGLKENNPKYPASIIHRQIKEEFKEKIPSESSIRKYLLSEGFQFKRTANRQGYIKFNEIARMICGR